MKTIQQTRFVSYVFALAILGSTVTAHAWRPTVSPRQAPLSNQERIGLTSKLLRDYEARTWGAPKQDARSRLHYRFVKPGWNFPLLGRIWGYNSKKDITATTEILDRAQRGKSMRVYAHESFAMAQDQSNPSAGRVWYASPRLFRVDHGKLDVRDFHRDVSSLDKLDKFLLRDPDTWHRDYYKDNYGVFDNATDRLVAGNAGQNIQTLTP